MKDQETGKGDKFSDDEKFILSQRPEITSRVDSLWIKKLGQAFPALSNYNFRLYILNQLVSMIGTWLQIVSQAWLVLQFTTSPVLIGIIAAFSTLPTFLFTLFGGVIVDRFSKKKIMIFTNTSSMVLALILGIITLLDVVSLVVIAVISFLLGTVNAIDAPARQAFMSELVEKKQLPSAIALNSGIFNAARAIGPGIAGILIATVGTGWAFILNAFSYIGIIIALYAMKVSSLESTMKVHPITAIKNGIAYSASHPIIRILLLFVGIISVFGWSYTTLLPLIVKTRFHAGAKELGYFYTAGGLGSLCAAILVAAWAGRISSTVLIIGGNCIFTISLLLFTMIDNFHLAVVFLFMAGLGLIAMAATINATLQHLVLNEYRGRVMSLYVLMFIGLIPLGNLQIGYVSEKLGTSLAIAYGACLLFICGMLLLFFSKSIRKEFQKYKNRNEPA